MFCFWTLVDTMNNGQQSNKMCQFVCYG